MGIEQKDLWREGGLTDTEKRDQKQKMPVLQVQKIY